MPNRFSLRIVAIAASLNLIGCASNSVHPARAPNGAPSTGRLIKGISVAYIHTPNKKLADWYEKTLGLQKGYGDQTWQEFEMERGSRFALDFIGYPSSTVQKQSIMISFEVENIQKAVNELAAKGVRFFPDNDKSKTIFDAGETYVATFEDPDGNFVQISQMK